MTLYEQVLAAVRPFLADQTEPFITRQCKLHLNIPVESLTKADLAKLAWWVKISASLVISKDKSESLAQKILTLAD